MQYIFQLCTEGNGPAQIASRLTKEKILSPSAYYYRKYGVALAKYNGEFPYNWEQKTVSGILENPAYLGHTVNLRDTTISYKNKKRVMHPESEWLRFENTHEAIIDQQTWDIVQEIRRHKKRRAKSAEQNIFSGMLYCMDCGHTLVLHRSTRKGQVENSFVCGAYRRQNQPHCTSSHYIREDDLRAVLLDDLRRVTCFARQNEALFARHISQKQNAALQKEITALEKEIDSAQKRIEELSLLFKRLYEDWVFGRLPEVQYATLSESYLQEQNDLKQQLKENHQQLEKRKAQIPNTARFTANAKKYTEITELTAEILHTFIQRIDIGARAEKKARYTTQEIRIIYRDIGILDDSRKPWTVSSFMSKKPPWHKTTTHNKTQCRLPKQPALTNTSECVLMRGIRTPSPKMVKPIASECVGDGVLDIPLVQAAVSQKTLCYRNSLLRLGRVCPPYGRVLFPAIFPIDIFL